MVAQFVRHKKFTCISRFLIAHNRSNDEVTVILQFNQGERKKCEAFIETIKNYYLRDKRDVYPYLLTGRVSFLTFWFF
jgi:hypothetical protein